MWKKPVTRKSRKIQFSTTERKRRNGWCLQSATDSVLICLCPSSVEKKRASDQSLCSFSEKWFHHSFTSFCCNSFSPSISWGFCSSAYTILGWVWGWCCKFKALSIWQLTLLPLAPLIQELSPSKTFSAASLKAVTGWGILRGLLGTRARWCTNGRVTLRYG